MVHNSMRWVFFGGSEFSVHVLDELLLHDLKPDLVITTPDRPKGRKLVLTPTPTKTWAKERGIPVLDPASLKKNNEELIQKLKSGDYDLFLVASYGKIIPKNIFEIPNRKTLNIHPSLLPKYRGASPIQSQILSDEKEVGVTVMQIDEGMDSGPIVVQKKVPFLSQQAQKCTDIFLLKNSSCSPQSGSQGISEPIAPETAWPVGRKELERVLAVEGARLFAHVLPEWLTGAIDPVMQNEKQATYCEKIEKEHGELQIDLNDLAKNARENLLKIKAFEEWPTAYFFLGRHGLSTGDSKQQRIIITDATLDENHALKILRVKPEGRNEMPFSDFLRGQKNLK